MTSVVPSLRELFWSFLRLGTTAFGGPAVVVYMRRMAVERKRWLDAETFGEGTSLCQSIPGATAMQMAAYVGLETRGVRGAVASFVGFGLPATIMMIVLGALYSRVSGIPMVVSTFSGLRVLIVAIVANAALSFGKASLRGWHSFIVAALATIAFLYQVHPLLVILAAALLGLAIPTAGADTHATTNGKPIREMVKSLAPMVAILILAFVFLLFADSELFALGALMLRIDLFAFGGGLAAVPLMFHEIVELRSWLPSNVFMDGIALGQITPGPVVITATFVGYMVRGFLGAITATVGVFAPSFLLVCGIAPVFDRLRTSPHFARALEGILSSFVGLLAAVTIRFGLGVTWQPAHIVLAVGALAALLWKVDILWVVIAGIIYSVVLG